MWYSHFSGSEMLRIVLVVPHVRSTVTDRIGPFQQRALGSAQASRKHPPIAIVLPRVVVKCPRGL